MAKKEKDLIETEVIEANDKTEEVKEEPAKKLFSSVKNEPGTRLS